ncbi:MAG: hypothetical protein COA69_04385 [Robiginitomaculum sp.]|nr:MAG: hypothetical protein COA69_04385 [Robiginitomaculum sp.]
MANILSFGADAVAGGIFGVFGTALGRVASYFERQQTFVQEEKRWGHELKLHELQMKAKKQETELELAIEAQKGSWRGLEASLQADANIGIANKWVINVLRLVRPALTLLLWLITAWIFSKTRDGNIASSAVFAATASTLWWFGDRAPKPQMGISYHGETAQQHRL